MRAAFVCVLSAIVCVACGDSGSAKKDTPGAQDAAANNGGESDAAATGDSGAVACPSDVLAAGEHTFDLTHDGKARRYLLHVPKGLSTAAPLVINFHGRNSNAGQQVFLSQMNTTSDEKGFVVAYPEGLVDGDVEGTGAKIQSWNGGTCCAAPDTDRDDVGFARAVVADIQGRVCVDAKRIYATGMSNGGFMTHKIACDAADLFAAAASVSGELVTATAEDCKPSRPLPMLMFHGTGDLRVPYEGTETLRGSRESFAIWRDKNGCTGEPEVSFSNGTASCETYKKCTDAVEVTLCTIEGMGHCWPGQTFCTPAPNVSTTDISANDAMWEMFERFTLP